MNWWELETKVKILCEHCDNVMDENYSYSYFYGTMQEAEKERIRLESELEETVEYGRREYAQGNVTVHAYTPKRIRIKVGDNYMSYDCVPSLPKPSEDDKQFMELLEKFFNSKISKFSIE